MNKKRITALVLCLAFLFTLASCGGEKYEPVGGERLAETPFNAELSEDGESDALLFFNAVYDCFSCADGTNALVQRFGNEGTYFEWMADKMMWTADEGYKQELKEKIRNYPQTDNGYFWSWGDSTYWPTGDGSMHYDGIFRYIAAVYDIVRWENSLDVLSLCDDNTVGEDTALDASNGRTVYDKCRLAMDYALNMLDGRSGAIKITEKSIYLSDGKTRFDINPDGKKLWENTGCYGSGSSNYWDNLCFGNLDAYETALFYHALEAMANIEDLRGEKTAAEDYRNLMTLVHEKFDELFWNPETGRYIACIDTEGNKHDFGLTFLNTEALTYGLGDKEKAKLIFDWLDGERTVEGDTITGSAIKDYAEVINTALGEDALTGNYEFALRTNTLAIEEKKSADGEYWWFSLNGGIKVGEGENAAFTHHLENGGYIFYTLYYELTARAKYQSAERMLDRAEALAKVYLYNGFNSDVGDWVEGLNGEFPENGLVCVPMLSEIIGIKPEGDTLFIAPAALSEKYTSLGVDSFIYGGKNLSAELREGGFLLKCADSLYGLEKLVFKLADGAKYEFVQLDGNGDEIKCETLVADENGEIRFGSFAEDAVSLDINLVR